MKLAELTKHGVDDEEFTPIHSTAGDVGLHLTLRDYNSVEYRSLAVKYYKAVSAAFDDKDMVNAVSECVACIKTWDVDDFDCTPENIIKLFKDNPGAQWIASQVSEHMAIKKLKAHKVFVS